MLEVLTHIWGVVTSDPEMKALFPSGAVGLYYSRGFPDQDRPYIAYSDSLTVADPWGILQGEVTFDIIDYSENGERAFAIRDRLVALMEKRYYDRVAGFTAIRISLNSEINLTESDQNLWRRVLTFGVRAVSAKDIGAVLDRP